MRARWEQLSVRDRRILRIAVPLVAALLFWALAWDPMSRAREGLRTAAQAQAAELAWMRPAAERLAASGGLAQDALPADPRSLLARVDAGAREAGLGGSLVAVEPQGQSAVRVQLNGAGFDALAAWLEREVAAGARVEEMSLRRSGAGQVDARILLAEGAR